MYRRFLNSNDYLGLLTEEAIEQLTRGIDDRLAMAEEAAEASVVEYLTEHYKIEEVLEQGKAIRDYTPQISYAAGDHFYLDGKIEQAIRVINCCVRPMASPYWAESLEVVDDAEPYSQYTDYTPGDYVTFAGVLYKALLYSGPRFKDIRVPGVDGWEQVPFVTWQANVVYPQWQVVKYDGAYYTLMEVPTYMDWTINPLLSDQYGAIADYDETEQYEFSETEYVVFNDLVYAPTMIVSAPELEENYNMVLHDPRHSNIKKHMLRLSVYELCKLISPNNVSQARIVDYETSITWLRDAARLKLNPQLPRRLDEEQKPVTDYALATFARDYDPNKNPWQI